MVEISGRDVSFAEFREKVAGKYKGNRDSLAEKLGFKTDGQVNKEFVTNKQKLHSIFVDLGKTDKTVVGHVNAAFAQARSEILEAFTKEDIEEGDDFIADLGKGKGSALAATAMHYYVLENYPKIGNSLNKQIFGPGGIEEKFQRAEQDDNSEDAEITGWVYAHIPGAIKKSVCGSVSIADNNLEPQTGDSIDADLMVRVSMFHQDKTLHLGFRTVRIDIDLTPTNGAQIKPHQAYTDKKVLCGDATATFGGTGIEHIWYISAVDPNGKLNGSYHFKEHPIASITPDISRLEEPCLVTVSLSIQAWEDHIVIEDKSVDSGETRYRLPKLTKEQEKIHEMLATEHVGEEISENGLIVFSYQTLEIHPVWQGEI